MPCPAPSLLPRQPRLSPDPSSDVPAGPSCRATHSSCDSQSLLQSAHTPHVPPGHLTRLRQPKVTPASVPRLPVSTGGPGLQWHPHVGLCPWQGEDAQTTHPLLSLLAEAASCHWPPQLRGVPPVLPWAGRCHHVPGMGPGFSLEGGGTAWHSSLTALLTPQALPGPPVPQPVPTEGSTSVLPPGQEDASLPGSHQLPRHPQPQQGKR